MDLLIMIFNYQCNTRPVFPGRTTLIRARSTSPGPAPPLQRRPTALKTLTGIDKRLNAAILRTAVLTSVHGLETTHRFSAVFDFFGAGESIYFRRLHGMTPSRHAVGLGPWF